MAKLSEEQMQFLRRVEVPLSSVYDATGQGPSVFGPIMKALGKEVAIGVTPCRKAGHTMRTRKNHCLQCNPGSIAFQRRHDSAGEVYVAGSLSKRIIKIGCSAASTARLELLNSHQYGGASDWRLLYVARTPNAGRVEFLAQAETAAFALPTTYRREGRIIDCLETFRCPGNHAAHMVRKHSLASTDEWVASNIGDYDFEPEGVGSHVRHGGPGTVPGGTRTPRKQPSNGHNCLNQNEAETMVGPSDGRLAQSMSPRISRPFEDRDTPVSAPRTSPWVRKPEEGEPSATEKIMRRAAVDAVPIQPLATVWSRWSSKLDAIDLKFIAWLLAVLLATTTLIMLR